MLRFFFSFHGRLNRAKFWAFWAVYIGLSLIISVITAPLDEPLKPGQAPLSGLAEAALIVISIVYVAIATWSYIVIHIKRWHDRNKSGWWVLIGFIPLIGFIWTMIECGCLRGTDGDNRFGPDPLAPGLETVFD